MWKQASTVAMLKLIGHPWGYGVLIDPQTLVYDPPKIPKPSQSCRQSSPRQANRSLKTKKAKKKVQLTRTLTPDPWFEQGLLESEPRVITNYTNRDLGAQFLDRRPQESSFELRAAANPTRQCRQPYWTLCWIFCYMKYHIYEGLATLVSTSKYSTRTETRSKHSL